MRSSLPRFSLPLLAKELVEQAARKRTYRVRTLYAVVLFAFSLLIVHSFFQYAGSNPLNVLGRGGDLFEPLVFVQFVAIYVFLPAMMCGSITREKERDSLVLLMLTTLRPWEIILQKYLSGLLPMAMFLMLSLPVMAVAYSLGGLESDLIIAAGVTIGLCCMQVGAMTLMLSAWCRSTAGAFIMFYVLNVAIVIVLLIAMVLADVFLGPYDMDVIKWGWCLFGPEVYHQYRLIVMYGNPLPLSELWWILMPITASVMIYLVLARVFLVRRAQVPPRNLLMTIFQQLDRFFTRANRITGGVTLWNDRESLPEDKPLAWRETARRGPGKLHHRMRVLMLFQIPVILNVVLTFSLGRSGVGFIVLLMLIWPIVVLILAVMGANVFNVERSRQTFDVLLTLPLTSRDIIQQKMAGIWRVVFTLMIPFLTIYLCKSYLGWGTKYALLYLVSSLLTQGIYLPLTVWLSVLVGLVARSSMRGVVVAVGVLAVWTVGVPVVLAILGEVLRVHDDVYLWAFLISPATMVVFTEFGELWDFDSPIMMVVVNTLIHGSILYFLRRRVLTYADQLLVRVASADEPAGGLQKA